MLIKSIVWQELSSHHGVLQCQMADVQKLLSSGLVAYDLKRTL
uniref:Uncharacterized protein n=1 Tax=Oryza rufipogon TaxID=4529 RepID=A0A0E0PPP5_ORYRU